VKNNNQIGTSFFAGRKTAGPLTPNPEPQFHMKSVSIQNISGNEVDYTA